jgi:putative membrane protein insertion efficiency factor
LNKIISNLIVGLIKTYRRIISPLFGPTIFGQRCKYFPSCSEYAQLAVENNGIKGVALAITRLFRCNPWSNGGVDYPPNYAGKTDKTGKTMEKLAKTGAF